MPIKIPDNLPARESLLSEAVDVINSSYAERQDIRPLKFLLLNLMPKKVPTEIQFARLIGASPLQIELTLMTTKSYQPKNTNQDYLIQFYKTLDDILYYTLLIINDQSFKNKNIPINIHAGKKIDEIKVKFNNFIKNISVIKNNNFAQVL